MQGWTENIYGEESMRVKSGGPEDMFIGKQASMSPHHGTLWVSEGKRLVMEMIQLKQKKQGVVMIASHPPPLPTLRAPKVYREDGEY